MIVKYTSRTRYWKLLFAISEILDALCIVFTLGQYKTELPLLVAKHQARWLFKQQEKKRNG